MIFGGGECDWVDDLLGQDALVLDDDDLGSLGVQLGGQSGAATSGGGGALLALGIGLALGTPGPVDRDHVPVQVVRPRKGLAAILCRNRSTTIY